MRGLRKNIKTILTVFIVMFVSLISYIGYSVYTNGRQWFASPYNARLTKQQEDVIAGSIKDRNGTVIAYSDENGKRLYIDDEATRRALCHVIGDRSGLASTGIENFHAQYLLGFSENVFDRVYQQVRAGKRRGDDVTTTLDTELSKYIYGQMGGYNGACVVMNYRTGEVLASVSKPGFELRTIQDFDPKNAEGSELVNRVTIGNYTPGSVFKTVTAAAVLRYKPELAQKTYVCTGKREYETGTVTCYNGAVHGSQTFQQAYSNSCNCAFAEMADGLDRSNMLSMANNLGFNKEEWMFSEMRMAQSKYEPAAKDSQLNFVWSSVGQFKDIVTPMHMCLITASVANEGIMMEPKLLKGVTNSMGLEYKTISPKEYDRPLQSEEAATLKEMMILTCKSGTGTKAALSNYTVGGKTGTAEVSDSKSVKPHSWFTGFIDSEECPVAIAIVLEYAGSGSSAATPAAGNILKRATELYGGAE